MNPVRTLKIIMQTVTMYTGAFCPYCTMAKKLLHSLGVAEINEIRVDRSPEAFAEMQQLLGQCSIPQIFIGDTHIGGFTDLYGLHREGRLDSLLNP